MGMTDRIMKAKRGLLFLTIVVLLAGCGLEDDKAGMNLFSQNFDFTQDQYGWQHGFADYPTGPDSTAFEFRFAYTKQPSGNKALLISGNNQSDDLFMYIKKKLDGLSPNTEYTVTLNVNLLCDANVNYSGNAGSPGTSVFFKVGATAIEPKSLIEQSTYVMNIDKGTQNESGTDMITVGDIATESASGYTELSRGNSASKPLKAKTNNKGELWLIVGTDSGFQGTTTLYYTKINVTLSASK